MTRMRAPGLLTPEPLTRVRFAPFGDVVEAASAKDTFTINQGFAERFSDIANIDVGADGGAANMGIVSTGPRPLPVAIRLMERHPLGSQVFFPLQERDWLVLVCADPQDEASFRAFRASGRQGINYARNTWHHPLLVLDPESRFLVIDRKGPGDNLEEAWLAEGRELYLSP